MDTITAIQQRRSIKQFDPSHVMPYEQQRELLSLSLLSPTSFNIQHWRLLVISDPQLRSDVQDAAWGQEQVTQASLLVLLCADIQAWRNKPDRYWRNAPPQTQKLLLTTLDNFYAGREQLQRDEALRSVGIASQSLMLAATAMGYGSSPMVGFDYDKIAELINLPEEHLIGMMLAIGKPAVDAKPRGGQLPYNEFVLENRFVS